MMARPRQRCRRHHASYRAHASPHWHPPTARWTGAPGRPSPMRRHRPGGLRPPTHSALGPAPRLSAAPHPTMPTPNPPVSPQFSASHRAAPPPSGGHEAPATPSHGPQSTGAAPRSPRPTRRPRTPVRLRTPRPCLLTGCISQAHSSVTVSTSRGRTHRTLARHSPLWLTRGTPTWATSLLTPLRPTHHSHSGSGARLRGPPPRGSLTAP